MNKSKELYIEPGAKNGWFEPRLSKKGQSGIVTTISYQGLVDILKEAGVIGSDQEAERLRITQQGIDVFLDGPPRTVGEAITQRTRNREFRR